MISLYDGATPWLDDNPPKGQPADWRLRTVKEHGSVGVSVYIVGSPGGMRHATAADVAAARALELGVIPNWERASDFFSTCTIADAKNAGAEALTACRALRFPDDGTIGVAFSFDFQCPANRYPEMLNKLAACRDGMGGHLQALGYGQQGLCDYWAAHGLPGPHWLMASTWGLSYNPGSRSVAMVQSHDAAGRWINSPVTGTDINTITQPDRLPAWWPDGSPYGGDMTPAELLSTPVKDLSGHEWTLERLLTGTNQSAWNAQQDAAAAVAQVEKLAAQVTELATTVAKIQTGGVDPDALAQAIAQHVKLAAD